MAKIYVLLAVLLLRSPATALAQHIDSAAVFILQRMSAGIRDLVSCSFTARASFDIQSDELGLVKHSEKDQVNILFPDKFKVTVTGDNGHKGLWYDGRTFSYYSFDNNTYAQAPAPPAVIQAFDTISKAYGVEFPGADFFYPSFVDDLLEAGGNLIYLGLSQVGETDCFHIAGKDSTKYFQFWITNDDLLLPARLVLVYPGIADSPQFEAVYDSWQINGILPQSMFNFIPPPAATRIKLQTRPAAE